MNWFDLLLTSIQNLWVRKLRTALNLVGVVISCVLLLSTLAAASGLRQAITRFVENSHEALRFRVVPTYDVTIEPPEEAIAINNEMSDRRKERMQLMLKKKWQRENLVLPRTISFDRIDRISKLENVVDVTPHLQFSGNVNLAGARKKGVVVASRSYFDTELRTRIIAGSALSAEVPEGVLLHESLAYEIGLRDDVAIENVIGTELVFDMQQSKDPFALLGEDFYRQSASDQEKLIQVIDDLLSGRGLDSIDEESLHAARKFAQTRKQKQSSKAIAKKGEVITKKLMVVGVYRDRDENDATTILTQLLGRSSALLVHHSQLRKLSLEMAGNGCSNATVYIDEVKNLEKTIETVKQESVRSISAATLVQRLYDAIDRSRYSVLVVAVVILLVAAIGISNTMIISLVERSEEIGILKSIGASNRDVTMLILFEGVMTGALGGLLSILFTYAISKVGNGLLRAYVEQRVRLDLEGQVFAIEPWMVFATMLVATLVATLAGIWPARKAAKLDPISAMGRI